MKVTSDTCSCSCNTPRQYLLPCRHVFVANFKVFGKMYLLQQLHPRWTRSYRPSVPIPECIVPKWAQLDLSDTATIPRSRQSMSHTQRYSQLLGLCTTICKLVSKRPAAYHDAMMHTLRAMEVQLNDATRVDPKVAALARAADTSPPYMNSDGRDLAEAGDPLSQRQVGAASSRRFFSTPREQKKNASRGVATPGDLGLTAMTAQQLTNIIGQFALSTQLSQGRTVLEHQILAANVANPHIAHLQPFVPNSSQIPAAQPAVAAEAAAAVTVATVNDGDTTMLEVDDEIYE